MSPGRLPGVLRSPWSILLLVAVGLELAGWALGGGTGTTTFAWYRVQAHAGLDGLVLTVLAGLAAAAATSSLLRWRPGLGNTLSGRWGLVSLGVAALALHLAFLDLPQAQPDTVTYFVYAQHFAREPLATLLDWGELAWSGPEARFHRPFPLVPLIYGLAFRVLGERWWVVQLLMTTFAVVLPLAVAWVGHSAGKPALGVAAGWLALCLPFLQCQTGWMLVDVPLLIFLCLAWGFMLRARGPAGFVLALVACVPALATKASGGLFLLGPWAAYATRHRLLNHRWLLPALALVGLALLAWVNPPRAREDASTWLEGAVAAGLHLRPSLWLLALAVSLGRERLHRLALGVLLALPVLVLWAPPEHVPRYALPLGLAICLLAAQTLRRQAPALVGLAAAGLALCFLGYRPLLVHNQAANLQIAARRIQERGARAIEIWSDQPGSNFSPAALAALVDLYTTVPVRYGGAVEVGDPDDKRHWWEVYEPPPWHLPVPDEPPPDGILLCLFGADADAFEAGPGAELRLLEEVSVYRASSLLLPQRVRLYQRSAAADKMSTEVPADQ